MRDRQVNDRYLHRRRRNHHHCRRHLHCHRDRQLNIPFRNLHLVIIGVAFVIIIFIPKQWQKLLYDKWVHFQYDRWNENDIFLTTGPDHWPKLFPQCAGQRQSPINIMTTDLHHVTWLPQFEFINYDKLSGDGMTPAFLHLRNNGHTGD